MNGICRLQRSAGAMFGTWARGAAPRLVRVVARAGTVTPGRVGGAATALATAAVWFGLVARCDDTRSVPVDVPPPSTGAPPAALEGLAPDEDAWQLVKVLYQLPRAPCFREACLWGIGSGGVASVSHFAINRHLPKATNMGVVAWLLVSLSSWYSCRARYKEQRIAIKDAFAKQGSVRTIRHNLPPEQYKGTAEDPGIAGLKVSQSVPKGKPPAPFE